ncbi:hypothetical protein CU097_011006 [Rhizopus azygosporus]|uniref:Transmembrane protein n=1 Tax=Rhizopus azygosporus TaxID=86630 RepID=A0A367K7K3_RHIAZ|nr:hypothetical protein CU097_011006 [Rhizopus azygosporus]
MRFDFLSTVIVFLALFATVFAAHGDHASSSQVAAPSTTSSAQAAATATAGSGHEGATTTTTTTVKKTVGNFDSPPVLMDGTLFWISLGISCGLWTTGKFIDVKIQRQERYAESRVHAL